ncbi:MAG: hypothetical protein QF411_05085, partial [Planctomycetota bacterium]|nr:hypothetical protein [Planctomycetota bacterium]
EALVESASTRADHDPLAGEVATTCASTQFLAVDLQAHTPRLPVGGGTARFTATVTSLLDLDTAWFDIRVPGGVAKPAGFPRNVALVPGEPHNTSFELELPAGMARHDIVAGLRAVHRGVDVAQFNNTWVAVGAIQPPQPQLSYSGSQLVREVRFGDPLRRDGR